MVLRLSWNYDNFWNPTPKMFVVARKTEHHMQTLEEIALQTTGRLTFYTTPLHTRYSPPFIPGTLQPPPHQVLTLWELCQEGEGDSQEGGAPVPPECVHSGAHGELPRCEDHPHYLGDHHDSHRSGRHYPGIKDMAVMIYYRITTGLSGWTLWYPSPTSPSPSPAPPHSIFTTSNMALIERY